MYDDNGDDDFDQPQRAPAQLPRELRDKLFDYSNPGLPALRYAAVGPEKWPASPAYGAKSGFTTWRNPTANDVRIVVNLGPDAALHTAFEMCLVPAEHRISRGRAAELFKVGQALRPEYCRLLVCIPPGGTLALPAVFDQGIRTVRNGVVVAGMAHMLEIEGEENPPAIHSSLVPGCDGYDPPPARTAAARRRS